MWKWLVSLFQSELPSLEGILSKFVSTHVKLGSFVGKAEQLVQDKNLNIDNLVHEIADHNIEIQKAKAAMEQVGKFIGL